MNELQTGLQLQTARDGDICVKLQHLPVEYFRPTEEKYLSLAPEHVGQSLYRLGTPPTLRGCSDSSLAQPTSLCRRTELIVSLERWFG